MCPLSDHACSAASDGIRAALWPPELSRRGSRCKCHAMVAVPHFWQGMHVVNADNSTIHPDS
jgi:hypothetical protein